MSADTRACQADKSREQTQMMTSAIAKAATKATAIVKANALSKFTSWAHVVCRNAVCSTARSQNARFVTFCQMGSVFAIALGP